MPFEKKPAPGFYDTGDEVAATKSMREEFRPVTIEEMEGKRRKVGGAGGGGQRRGWEEPDTHTRTHTCTHANANRTSRRAW